MAVDRAGDPPECGERGLLRLLQIEVTATDARRLAGRFRFANRIDKNLLAELDTCRYINDATNVLLIGPPGVGKHTSRPDSGTPP